MQPRIAVIGLGYVGLPVALAFGRRFPGTVGFDINRDKVEVLRGGEDPNGELEPAEVQSAAMRFTTDPKELRGSNFFVVAVPTPVDANHNPDLSPLISASRIVGEQIEPGSIVVFESTVYPGVTEEICGPIIAEISNLTLGKDFFLGYSPERINPGDKNRTLEKIVKVVSGQDDATLEAVASLYGEIIEAGVHRAESIKVAEAAKVIENTQRDLNIALMNELAVIFDKMGISTKSVLDAASTKWNFLRFNPGLVGGHCIGVDPYYLTTKAEQLGYHPQVILAGRRINDSMGSFIAQRAVKLMVNNGAAVKGARVGILGITFKENVKDIRNSRVPDIYYELKEFGIHALIHDPVVTSESALEEYGIPLTPWEEMVELDCLILAVSHREYLDFHPHDLCGGVKRNGVVMDVKSALTPSAVPPHVSYWSL